MNKFFILIIVLFLNFGKGRLEIILERCLPKADMENISIKCSSNEVIAIREAFFTSSMVDQCRFIANDDDNKTSMQKINSQQQQQSCTDDLRLTLNSKCSGHQACRVNLRKSHNNQCSGYDGWINLKYICVPKIKMNSYCNIKLTDSFGYVSNPGYPKFYPPYDCKWKIIGYPGQRIQIEILDLSLKEPRFTSNKKLLNNYECTDNLAIIDQNIRRIILCGELKSNLIEYRSKSNELVIDFRSFEFSPTRGIFFLIDCPTLRPPSNGYMYRNQSYAYYNCYFNYVFEDTGQTSKILFCEYETYWNGTVTRCIAKENTTNEIDANDDGDDNGDDDEPIEKAYALSHQRNDLIKYDQINNHPTPQIITKIDDFLTNPLTFIIIGIISLSIIIIIIAIIIHSNYRYGSTDISI
uniref:Uncharacterized protein LOC113795889 isoform X2 n=1 Tax=Dermatophagoides pteronyssinus TaxID=6956 RepID=A0A6P6YAE8_DERPT|nr:uncharacterized protein LOC113795889 isoform X2 [Dermatophagoides pteronyssinus]